MNNSLPQTPPPQHDQNFDPNSDPNFVDPNAVPFDPNAAFDPNFDPNTAPFDPNAVYLDPNAPPAYDPVAEALAQVEQMTPLKRFWRKYGGESFLISVGVHIVFFILAYVVFKTVVYIATAPQDDFVTGAGGGNEGNKVSMLEHRIKPKHAKNAAKNVPKLVAKGASSISLPEMPKMTMALESGSPMGASSKGFGGGAGGGVGGGIGPGRGGGRNMVSLFGGTGFGMPGLTGTFYDFKQTAKGVDRGYNTGRYLGEVRTFFKRGWDVSYLESHFFKAPVRLTLTELYIPDMGAGGAPAAFQTKVQPSNWLVHYRGRVTAPFSGRFRFVGLADDLIGVRWDGKNTLVNSGGDSGALFETSKQGNKYGSGKPLPGTGDTYPGFRGGWPMRVSPWLSVNKGSKYNLEIAIGEAPGSFFCAFLCFELEKEKGKVMLFRMDAGKMLARNGPQPPNVDWSGGGYIWKPEVASGPKRSR